MSTTMIPSIRTTKPRSAATSTSTSVSKIFHLVSSYADFIRQRWRRSSRRTFQCHGGNCCSLASTPMSHSQFFRLWIFDSSWRYVFCSKRTAFFHSPRVEATSLARITAVHPSGRRIKTSQCTSPRASKARYFAVILSRCSDLINKGRRIDMMSFWFSGDISFIGMFSSFLRARTIN